MEMKFNISGKCEYFCLDFGKPYCQDREMFLDNTEECLECLHCSGPTDIDPDATFIVKWE